MSKSLLILGTSHSAGTCIPSGKKIVYSEPPRSWLRREQRWFKNLYHHYDEIVVLARPGATTHQQFYALRQYIVKNPNKKFTHCIFEGRGLGEKSVPYITENIVPEDMSTFHTTYDHFIINQGDSEWYEHYQKGKTNKTLFQEMIGEVKLATLGKGLLNQRNWSDDLSEDFIDSAAYFFNKYDLSWQHLIETGGLNMGILHLMKTISEKVLYFPFHHPSPLTPECDFHLEKVEWLTGFYANVTIPYESNYDFPLNIAESIPGAICGCGHANQKGTDAIAHHFHSRILEYFNKG